MTETTFGTTDAAPSMRAVRLHEAGGPDQLSLDRVAVPTPGPGEVLVRVHSAAITRDELEWPVDRLPAIPSYELSGVVASVSAGVDPALIGQAVFGLTAFDRDGAAADFAAVPAELLAPKPDNLDHSHAATLPLPGLSAWQGLFEHGGLYKEQRVLILGATGGVGQFATQLARLHGAYVIGTASRASRELAGRLGAQEVLDPADADALTGLAPVDLVFDTVGGDLVRGAGARIRSGGRLVSVAAEPPKPTDDSVATTYFVVEPNRDQLAELGRLAGNGDLLAAVDSVFPLERAREAFARSQASRKHGKVVLSVVDE